MPWVEFEDAKAELHMLIDPSEYTSFSLDKRELEGGVPIWIIIGTRKDGSDHEIIAGNKIFTDRGEMKKLFNKFTKLIMS